MIAAWVLALSMFTATRRRVADDRHRSRFVGRRRRGRAVIVRVDRRAGTADHDRSRRPLHRRRARGRDGDAHRPRRRLRRNDATADGGGARGRARHRRRAGRRARNRHGDADPQRAAARRHAGERQRPDQRGNQASPAVVADDVLRQIPTFSLFRRTSSLSAHPTSQGVSLRGIGPSGVSRTLVLLDGVPFNDPFGGWVYWTRVPLESVDRIEVVDGSTSSLYGNYAMGGVINIVTSRPTRRTVEHQAAVRHARAARRSTSSPATRGTRSAAVVEGSVFNTDGFPIVAAIERGPDRQQRDRQVPELHRRRSSTRRPIACSSSSAAAISPRTASTARSAR